MKALIWLLDNGVIACLAESAGAARAERTDKAATVTVSRANIRLPGSHKKTAKGKGALRAQQHPLWCIIYVNDGKTMIETNKTGMFGFFAE